MQFENSFEVALPPDEAWALLLDIERIAPCLPGAEITEVVDERTYKGKVAVRLGPVALSFAGQVAFDLVDDAARRATLKAKGADSKGRGGAAADVQFVIEPVAAGAKVVVRTDLALSGAIAQYGRGAGMIQDLADHLISQFAGSLAAQLAASPSGAGAPPPAKPISGLTLGLRLVWRAVVRRFTSRSAPARDR